MKSKEFLGFAHDDFPKVLVALIKNREVHVVEISEGWKVVFLGFSLSFVETVKKTGHIPTPVNKPKGDKPEWIVGFKDSDREYADVFYLPPGHQTELVAAEDDILLFMGPIDDIKGLQVVLKEHIKARGFPAA
jgi:hypothetical protein